MSNGQANWQYQRDWEAIHLIPQLKQGVLLMKSADQPGMKEWVTWAEKFLKDWEEDEYTF